VVPGYVAAELAYASLGTTYHGYTLLTFWSDEYPCGADCCGYAEMELRIRTPSGEVFLVKRTPSGDEVIPIKGKAS